MDDRLYTALYKLYTEGIGFVEKVESCVSSSDPTLPRNLKRKLLMNNGKLSHQLV